MKLPEYDAPQVAPEALPGVRAQALVDPASGAVGAGIEKLGQGIQQLGQGGEQAVDAMAEVRERVALKADTLQATNQATQLKHDLDTGLMGNKTGTGSWVNGGGASPTPLVNPDTGKVAPGMDAPTGPSQKAVGALDDGKSGLSPKGVLNEQGVNADAYAHSTMVWGAKRADELQGQLRSPRAQQMFREMAAAHLEDARVSIERHTAQQAQAAEEASLHAATASALQSVTKNYADAGAVERNLAILEPSIKALALSPEDAAAKIAAVRQQGYTSVVQQYIADKDYKGAQAAMSQYGDALGYGEHGGEHKAQLEHTIGVLREQQQGEQIGAGIVNAHKDASGMVNAPMAIADLEALPPEKRRIAEEAFHKHLGLAETANRTAATDMHTMAYGQWVKSHSLSDVAPDVKSRMQKIDPVGWHGIEEADRQWKDQQAAAARGRKVEPTPEQSLAVARARVAIRDNPDGFKDVTPDDVARAYGGQVLPKQLEELQDAVRMAHGQKPVNDKTLLPAQTNTVIQTLRDSKAIGQKEHPNTAGGNVGVLFDRITDHVQTQREGWKSHNKGEPPLELVQQWAAEANKPVEVEGTGIFGSNYFRDKVPTVTYQSEAKYRGKMATDAQGAVVPEPVTKAEPTHIPGPERLAITTALMARGAHPSEELVQQVYARRAAPAGAGAQAKPAPGLTSELTPTAPKLSSELTPTAKPGRAKLVAPELKPTGQPTTRLVKPGRDPLVHPTLAGLMQRALDSGDLDL